MPQMEQGTYLGSLQVMYGGELNNEKQTPFIGLEFEVSHIAVNGEWQDLPAPRTRTVKWFVTEKAEPYTMEKLLQMGFNGDMDSPQFDSWNQDQAILTCEINENDYEDWDVDLRTGGSQGETWEQDSKKKFEAKFKSYAETRGQNTIQTAPKAAPTPQGDTDSPVTDDEIPGGEDDVSDSDIPF